MNSDTGVITSISTGNKIVVYMDRIQMNRYVEETFAKAGEIMKMRKEEEAKQKK